MNAQMEIPGLRVELENDQLTVETPAEDVLCGRALAIAKTWALWQMQGSKNEHFMDAPHRECSPVTGGVSTHLREMQALEALTRRNSR